MTSEKILIIIPTYNEIENIEILIKEIYAIDSAIDILVVDDNSPDGTGKQVKKLKDHYKNLFLIERERGACVIVNVTLRSLSPSLVNFITAPFLNGIYQ